jgi:hypothetical protein
MIRCGVCKTIKEEQGNHWWALYLSRSMPADKMSLTLTPLSVTAGVEPSSYIPACGNNCTQKLVERWLHTGSFEAPRCAAGEPA